MQLYHHPYSMDSQKVRLALEENGIDYTSYHVNPITGKNMDAAFFRMNPSATLPVFQNGSQVIFRAMDIIQYIDKLVVSLDGRPSSITTEVMDWILRIDKWNPKIFTLNHISSKYRLFVSRFIRRVIIARMADSPDLASDYHVKLREEYEFEEAFNNRENIKLSEEMLHELLDDVEQKLHQSTFLAGNDFTLADSMFIPVLVRLSLLNLEDEYVNCRPKIVEYYEMVKKRASYKKVIGNHFKGWRKYRILMKTVCFLLIRSIFRRY